MKLRQQGKHTGNLGYPQRKTRQRGLGSVRLTGTMVVFPAAIQLPRLGRRRLKERGYLPTAANIRSATVSEQAGHCYVSVLVEQELVVPVNTGPVDWPGRLARSWGWIWASRRWPRSPTARRCPIHAT